MPLGFMTMFKINRNRCLLAQTTSGVFLGMTAGQMQEHTFDVLGFTFFSVYSFHFMSSVWTGKITFLDTKLDSGGQTKQCLVK